MTTVVTNQRCAECHRVRTLDQAGLCHECWQVMRDAEYCRGCGSTTCPGCGQEG